jgi:hypothetical protein
MKGCAGAWKGEFMRRLLGRIFVGAALIFTATVAMAAEASQQPSGLAPSNQVAVSTWSGPWDLTTPYRKDETVIHNGTTFVATQDNFMEEPGSTTQSWKRLPGKASPPPGEGAFMVAMGR